MNVEMSTVKEHIADALDRWATYLPTDRDDTLVFITPGPGTTEDVWTVTLSVTRQSTHPQEKVRRKILEALHAADACGSGMDQPGIRTAIEIIEEAEL